MPNQDLIKKIEQVYQEFLNAFSELEQKQRDIIAEYRARLEELKLHEIRKKIYGGKN